MEFLIKSPTIRRLAHTLADPRRDRYQYLIPLADKGHRPPLFFAPAGIEYMPMTRALGEDQPVIGLSIYRDVHDVQAPNCLEDLAADYIQEMLDFQPQGPYFLCGSSLAGIVASEIARQWVWWGCSIHLPALENHHDIPFGWRSLAKEGVTVHRTQGGHMGLFQPEFSQSWISILRDSLHRSQQNT